jgi:DNA processing protein
VADVLETIRPLDSRVRSERTPFEPAAEAGEADEGARKIVEELLGPSPVPVDELLRQSDLPSGAVQLVLLELDLAGRLDRHAGGKVSLR